MKPKKRITAVVFAAVILFSACTQTGVAGRTSSGGDSVSAGVSSETESSAQPSDSSELLSSAEASSGTVSSGDPSSAESILQQLSSAAEQVAESVASPENPQSAASQAQKPTASKAPATSTAPAASKTPAESKKPAESTNTIVPAAGTYSGAINIRLPSASGSVVYSDGESTIDASNAAQGYIMFYTDYSDGARLKLQIKASATYNYDIVPKTWYTFPLQMGSGSYEIKVMENTDGSKYRKKYGETISVALSSALSPYLYPNQFVNYTASSKAIKKSFDLCVNAKSEAQKVAAIYNYVTTHIKYDSAKAATVASGYLPNVDSTLASGKGICFDYAALTAAMLRAQGIPTKLAIGTKDGMSHAWNYIYMQGTGWIAVKISFSGGKWNFADTTFAADGSIPTEGGYATLRVY